MCYKLYVLLLCIIINCIIIAQDKFSNFFYWDWHWKEAIGKLLG